MRKRKKVAKRKPHWSAVLREMGACGPAIRFARRFKALDSAWVACGKPWWIAWLVNNVRRVHAYPGGKTTWFDWKARTRSVDRDAYESQEGFDAARAAALRMKFKVPKLPTITKARAWARRYA